MGTRSLTIILDRDGKEFATIYRHWDGYPEAHGQDLKDWLSDKRIVNGLPVGVDTSKMINGLGRLAALVISKLHESGHQPSIMESGAREVGEEFIYVLSCQKDADVYGRPVGPIHLEIYVGPVTAFGHGGQDCTNKIYDGLISELDINKL